MGLPSKKRSSNNTNPTSSGDDSNLKTTTTTTTLTKGNKKKKSTNHSSNNNDRSVQKLEQALLDGRKEAQKEFEMQRTSIYNTLSPSYQQMFQTIVFAKWKKTYLPALILSPYSVPPGPVRTSWMERYEKCLSKNMLDLMVHLLYWYGTKVVTDYYGFISKSNFTTYDEEVKKGAKGLHNTLLSKKVQLKLQNNESLTPAEEDMVRTYKEVQEDLAKDPQDRKRGVIHFQEGYEMLSIQDLDEMDLDDDGDDDDENSDNDDDSDNNGENDDGDDEDDSDKEVTKRKRQSKERYDESKKKTSKGIGGIDDEIPKKTKEGMKTKNKKNDSSSSTKSAFPVDSLLTTVGIEDNDESIDTKIPATDSTPKKKSSSKKRDLDQEDILASSGQKKKVKKDPSTTALSPKKKPTPVAAAASNEDLAEVHSDGIGDEDNDDDDDKNISDGDESSAEFEHDDDENRIVDTDDEDDKDDQDFVENVIARKKPQQQKFKKIKEKKGKPVKKEQKVKTKIELPKTDKQLKRKEMEMFHRNEESYMRLIRRWESAIQSENVDRIRRIMNEANDVVQHFCYSFLLCYDLSTIIKDSKRILKNANDDLVQFTTLKEKIKTTFETKRLLIPKGYIVPKRTTTTSESVTKQKSNNDLDTSEHDQKNKESTNKDAKQENITGRDTSITSNTDITSSQSQKSLPGSGVGSSKLPTDANTNSSSMTSFRTNPNTAPKFKSLLGNIMQKQNRPSSLPQSKSNETSTSTTAVTNVQYQVPMWASTTTTTIKTEEDEQNDKCYTEYHTDEVRSMGLEFLEQMAMNLTFPDGISINVEAMSRSIESAIYDWSQKQHDQGGRDPNWTKSYWSKIHPIIAAFCGSGHSTAAAANKTIFYQKFIQGKFDTPDKIVNLSDDQYAMSFGR